MLNRSGDVLMKNYSSSNHTLLEVDVVKAVNPEIREEKLPERCNWINWSYGETNNSDFLKIQVFCATALQQGDSLGPMEFSLAPTKLAEGISVQTSPKLPLM